MSNFSEKDTSLFNRFELQPWHIVVLVALGACAVYPNLIMPLVGCIVAGCVVWNVAEKQRIQRENTARLAGIINHCAPVVVPSLWITEDVNSVAERAAQIKKDLKDSGNPYADIIPVVPYPYSPMLFGVGQLSMSWGIYQRMVGEQQHLENIKWYEGKCPSDLKPIFASQVMPAPKQIVE